MSITDELREYAHDCCARVDDAIHAIADRIDAEYEEAVQQALMGEGGVPATDENMAEHGWVRKEEGKTISTCYVDVVPRFDWELMAQELEQFAEIVRGMAGDAE